VKRRRIKADLGEAISFDSILTVLTVLMVLRMIYLIPMVNLDKAKVDQARHDRLWTLVIHRLASKSMGIDSLARPYLGAFGITAERVTSMQDSAGRVRLEALSPDSTLDLVEHDTRTGRFVAMRVQASSEHPVFRRGLLLWSREEGVWFPTADSTDYGQDSSSLALVERARQREATR